MKITDIFIENFIKVNKYINRPLASFLVKVLLPTRITPNQVTIFGFILGLAGAVFFVLGKYVYFVIGGSLVQLSSIVDCADGMLARARNASSAYGAFLDIFLDRLNEFFIIAGFTMGYYIYSGNLTLLIFGGLALSLYFLQITLYYSTKKYRGNDINNDMNEPRGLLLILVFVFALLNRLDLWIYLLLIVSIGTVGDLVVGCFKLSKKQS